MRSATIPVSWAFTTLALAWPLATHGQEIIRIDGPDRPVAADFHEIYRIGAARGQPWELFTRVHQLGFDAEGNLFVFDGAGGMDPNARILVFDPAGHFMREFGTAGEGPGEFSFPISFAILPTGATVVSDLGHRGYHIFDPLGDTDRMVTATRLADATILGGDLHADPRGGAVFATPRSTGPQLFGDSVLLPRSRPIVRIALEGADLQPDTIVQARIPPREQRSNEIPDRIIHVGDRAINLQEAVGSMTTSAIFEPELLVGILPNGGIVYSDSSDYAVKITEPGTGHVVRIVTRPISPEPVTPAMKREYLKNMERQTGVPGGGKLMDLRLGSSSGDRHSPQQGGVTFALEPAPFYPELSVLEKLGTTWNGRIWVQRRGSEHRETGSIDIFQADGAYLGTLPAGGHDLPDAFGPNGLAAFIELNEFDVPTVIVRRLPSALR